MWTSLPLISNLLIGYRSIWSYSPPEKCCPIFALEDGVARHLREATLLGKYSLVDKATGFLAKTQLLISLILRIIGQ
jgi:hypothetical protein